MGLCSPRILDRGNQPNMSLFQKFEGDTAEQMLGWFLFGGDRNKQLAMPAIYEICLSMCVYLIYSKPNLI